ncbi:hypothetical protein TMatcc_004003 [Talaromyces marneffei ATCC 18224]
MNHDAIMMPLSDSFHKRTTDGETALQLQAKRYYRKTSSRFIGYLRNQLSYTRHAHIRNIREKLPNKSFIIRLLTSVLRIRTNLRLHSFCGQFLELIVLSRWNILRRVASCGKRLPFA